MKNLTQQDLLDLVDGAAIFSAGGGDDPEIGYTIVERMFSEGIRLSFRLPLKYQTKRKLLTLLVWARPPP